MGTEPMWHSLSAVYIFLYIYIYIYIYRSSAYHVSSRSQLTFKLTPVFDQCNGDALWLYMVIIRQYKASLHPVIQDFYEFQMRKRSEYASHWDWSPHKCKLQSAFLAAWNDMRDDHELCLVRVLKKKKKKVGLCANGNWETAIAVHRSLSLSLSLSLSGVTIPQHHSLPLRSTLIHFAINSFCYNLHNACTSLWRLYII